VILKDVWVNTDKSWINALLDGSLPDDQAERLIETMHQDPETLQHVLKELDMSDLMARTLDPARSDEVFMSQLDSLLDGDMGGDFDDDGDLTPDGSDSGSPNIDPTSASGLSTTAKVWAGICLSAAIAGGAAVMHIVSEDPLPPPPNAAPAPTHIDIIAEADAALHVSAGEINHKLGKQDYYVLHNIINRHDKCGAILRFDLSELPEHAEKIYLRLYAAQVQENMKPIAVRLVVNDDWEEASITGAQALWGVKGNPLATFMPVEGEFASVELTDIVLSEKAKDGVITLRLDVPGRQNIYAQSVFYSHEHDNPAHQPALRVMLDQATAADTDL
jgi:hypothetical protein